MKWFFSPNQRVHGWLMKWNLWKSSLLIFFCVLFNGFFFVVTNTLLLGLVQCNGCKKVDHKWISWCYFAVRCSARRRLIKAALNSRENWVFLELSTLMIMGSCWKVILLFWYLWKSAYIYGITSSKISHRFRIYPFLEFLIVTFSIVQIHEAKCWNGRLLFLKMLK